MSQTPRDTDTALPVSPSRHSVYYFEDGVVVFLVENTLFKVHRYYLTRESEVFRGMFESPPTPDGPEGTDDERPIRLPDLAKEFEALMDFFYQGMRREETGVLGKCEPGKAMNKADHIQEWVNLLCIADRYLFHDVRNEAIKAIESVPNSLNVTERLRLAMLYAIQKWEVPIYVELCLQRAPLTYEQASIIGLKKFVDLVTARELVCTGRSSAPSAVRYAFPQLH